MDIKEFLRGALTAPEKGDTVEYFNLKARVSGNVLTNAQRNIPSPGYTYEADITKFWEEFQNLKENCGYHLTFNTVMMKVLAEGLKAAPRLNAHLESPRSSTRQHKPSCCWEFCLPGENYTDIQLKTLFRRAVPFQIEMKDFYLEAALKHVLDETADT